MPQEHSRRARRGTLDSDGAPTLRSGVAARPLHRVDRSEAKVNGLLGALSAVEPGLSRYLQAEQDLQVEEDYRAGQTAATQETRSLEEVNQDIRDGKLAPTESPYFRRGYMQLHGRKAARENLRNIQQKMAAGEFNPDTDDLEQFLAENADDLNGLADEDFHAGYQPTLERGLAALRSDNSDYQASKVRSNIHEELSYTVQDVIDNSGPLNAAELDALKGDYAETFNIPKKEIEGVMLETMERYADEGRPEVFDVFFEKRPDGTPGLAHHPEMGPKVAALQRKAKQIERSKVDADRIQRRDKWWQMARDGKFNMATVINNERALRADFTPGEVESLLHYQVRGSAEALAQQQYIAAFQNGTADYLPDGKVKDAAWRAYESNILASLDMPALEDGTPDYKALIEQSEQGNPKALAAMSILTTKLKQSGYENGTWKDILTNTGQNGIVDEEGNISEDFLTGYKLSRQLKGTGLLRAHVADQNTGKLYDAFDQLRRQYPEGVAADTAWRIVNDPEWNAEFEARADYTAIDAKVNDLADGPGLMWWSDDAVNSGTARVAIAKKAKLYIKAGASIDSAFDKAVEDFQDEWVNLDGRWVQSFSGQFKRIEPRMEDLRDLAMRQQNVDGSDYADVRLTTDPVVRNRMWLVDLTGMPVSAPIPLTQLWNDLEQSEKLSGTVRVQTANDVLNEHRANKKRDERLWKEHQKRTGNQPGLVDPAMARRLYDEAERSYKDAMGKDDLSEEDRDMLDGLHTTY